MYKSILLPIDLRHEGSWKKALPTAIEIAEKFDAQLHLVSIVPNVGMSIVSQYLPKNFEKSAIEEASIALKEFAAKNVPTDVRGRCHIAHGTVREQIVKAGEKLGCDLIVMAPHHPEALDAVLSVKTNYVVHNFKGSVLVVRD